MPADCSTQVISPSATRLTVPDSPSSGVSHPVARSSRCSEEEYTLALAQVLLGSNVK